ncbi:MAG TPA: DNA helicase RecQ [Flavobacteriales bacterium]|nr:DNA helicase RecQ [Flavobacteriales bacterium]
MIDTQISIHESLQKFFGFNKFKGHQEAIVKNVLTGNHSFVIMPTGGGKSLCYQLPALIMDGTAVIVSPLIALMKNQVDSIRNYGSEDGVAHFLNSSLTKSEITQVKKDIVDGKTKLLYVAPESLNKQENIDFLASIKVSFFAIDEAHCISEWGHDFRPEYRRLRPMFDRIGNVPIMALTATATPKVQADVQKNLGMMDATLFKASFNRANLFYEVQPKVDVVKQIVRYIKTKPGKSGIVYCLSRKKVEEIAEVLKVNGIKALGYHAGMDSATRAKHQDAFLMEEVDVIVATIAFGMGIDKPDVRYVIHHDIPKSLEGYYQETGRAGRDGGEGHCLAFYSYKDIEKLEKFLHGKPVSEMEIGRQLLHETVSFAETSLCRRKYLLYYFGEEFDETQCNKQCDNCKNPREKFNGQEEVELLLEAVAETKEKHKGRYLISLLIGDANSEVKTYKHDKLEIFGKGSERSDKFWGACIRQTVVGGLLRKEIESYGTLHLTQRGRDFLENPFPFELLKEHNYEGDGIDDDDILTAESGGGVAADEALFTMLKDLRRQLAKQKNVPPFVIFQDPTLEDMATHYPITMEELKNISGVGAGKAERFGKEFIQLIDKYVKENNIERPDDFVVKSIVNKSGLKVHIIQAIDRKMPLDAFAESKRLTFNELLNEIDTMVSTGTRLNIDYFINEYLDKENQEEIFDYFREADNDSIDGALKEFSGAYTDEELRLVRIKFYNELGN